MLRRLAWFGIAALVFLAAGRVTPACAQEGGAEWVGKPAPAFALKDIDGKEIRLADYAGKKVVWLNFWGLRCGPCVRELPALQKLYAKYASRGVLIVGVNTDGVPAAFIRKAFAERSDLQAAGVTFPLTPDEDFKVIDAYGLMGAPLNVMIDKRGVIRYHHEGYEDGDEATYQKTLEKLVND